MLVCVAANLHEGQGPNSLKYYIVLVDCAGRHREASVYFEYHVGYRKFGWLGIRKEAQG